MHVYHGGGFDLFIGEGHVRHVGLTVGEQNTHRVRRNNLVVCGNQLFPGRDKVVAFRDGHRIGGKFLPIGHVMDLDLRPDDRLLIAEGNDGGLRLSVHELHLHRVGLHRLVAFGHVLVFRRYHGFLRGHGHISAAELRAVFIHIGHVDLSNAAQLHKIAYDVADLFLTIAKIANVVPQLAVQFQLTMHGHRRLLTQRADNVAIAFRGFRSGAEVDRALFRYGITGHVVHGCISAVFVGFGAGFGRFLGLVAAGIAGVSAVAGIASIPGISGIAGAARVTAVASIARIAVVTSVSSIANVATIAGVASVSSAAAVAGIAAGVADGPHVEDHVSGNAAVLVYRNRLRRSVDRLIAGDLALPVRRELIHAGGHVVAGIIQQLLHVLGGVKDRDRSVHRRGLRDLLGGQIHIAAAGVVGFFLVAVEFHQRHGLRRVRRRYVLLRNRHGLIAVPPEIGHIIEVGTSVRHSHGDLQGPRGAVHGLSPIIGDPVLPHRQLSHGAAGLAVGVRVGHIDGGHVRRFRGQRPQRGRQLQKNHQQTGQ